MHASVCVSLEYKYWKLFLIRLRCKTQWWKANFRVGRSWDPNTFPRTYLNSETRISGSKIKKVPPREDVIYMVPRPLQKLGGDSPLYPQGNRGNNEIFTLEDLKILFEKKKKRKKKRLRWDKIIFIFYFFKTFHIAQLRKQTPSSLSNWRAAFSLFLIILNYYKLDSSKFYL